MATSALNSFDIDHSYYSLRDLFKVLITSSECTEWMLSASEFLFLRYEIQHNKRCILLLKNISLYFLVQTVLEMMTSLGYTRQIISSPHPFSYHVLTFLKVIAFHYNVFSWWISGYKNSKISCFDKNNVSLTPNWVRNNRNSDRLLISDQPSLQMFIFKSPLSWERANNKWYLSIIGYRLLAFI